MLSKSQVGCFVLGWSTATLWYRYKLQSKGVSLDTGARTLEQLLENLCGSLTEVLSLASASPNSEIGFQVDLRRLILSAQTTLDLLRNMVRCHFANPDIRRLVLGRETSTASTEDLPMEQQSSTDHHHNAKAYSGSMLYTPTRTPDQRDHRRRDRVSRPSNLRTSATPSSLNSTTNPSHETPFSTPNEQPPSEPSRIDTIDNKPPMDSVMSTPRTNEFTPVTLFEKALQDALAGNISCRSYRPKYCGCKTKMEYTAKLHCVRQCCDQIFSDPIKNKWFQEKIKGIFATMLARSSSASVNEFSTAFDNMVNYVNDCSDRSGILPELTNKNIDVLNVYDIAIDYMLLDAFDDLENPPSSVTSALSASWVGASIRRKCLETAVWSIIKARANVSFGAFKTKYYGVTLALTPFLASGLLGCGSPEFNEGCRTFKTVTLRFVHELFDSVGGQLTIEELVDDMMAVSKDWVRDFEAVEVQDTKKATNCIPYGASPGHV
eukprot:m.23416 g.23416  ORF g.23416 m.23416 type:complete len:492 (-) comp14205_c0_seq1:15-1490(-)